VTKIALNDFIAPGSIRGLLNLAFEAKLLQRKRPVSIANRLGIGVYTVSMHADAPFLPG